MMTRYSKTTGTFYPFDIDYKPESLPADIQEVSLADYETAMARPAGYSFSFDAVGKLTIAPPPAAPLVDQQTAAIKRIDADVDAIYRDVVGNRQTEYDLAESDAQAYKAAGYTGTALESVQSWADAKKKTAQWAADDILMTATLWRRAQAAIRSNRLMRKEEVRNASKPAGVDTALATWAEYVVQTRTELGI